MASEPVYEPLPVDAPQYLNFYVKSIEFEGLQRTNSKLLHQALTDCYYARDLSELSRALTLAFDKFNRLNIFKEVAVVIDQAGEPGAEPNASGSWSPSLDRPQEIKLIFKVKEKRMNIKTGTEFRRRDVAWNFGGSFYNIFGNAEVLDLSTSIGASSSVPFSVNFVKPMGGDPDRLFIVNACNVKENFLNGCNWKNDIRAASAAFQVFDRLKGRHELKYLAEWRRLYDLKSGSSHIIRDQAGASLKSSLIHTWSKSTRDDTMLPTSGRFMRLVTEIAGAGGLGNQSFCKGELFFQNNWTPSWTRPFIPITLSQSFKFGHAVPIGQSSFIPISDRFFMGGPTSIRGFVLNSLGPRQFSDALGGTTIAELGFQISFPIFQRAANFARGHLFLNAGVLGEPNLIETLSEGLTSVRKHKSLLPLITSPALQATLNPNVSVGAGLMFKMAESARLEFNFTMPLIKQPDVHVERGIQVGIGMEFL